MFKPRPAQKLILEYKQGKMGIKAVPGSGKTHTLSYLAAQLILSEAVAEDQEILIVTLVNSAVENFSSRISQFIQGAGLLPNTGYRVRTLHGLAHDIVRERPDLAGLSDRFQIIDERESASILADAVSQWLRLNPEMIVKYTAKDQNLQNNSKLLKDWNRLLVDTATSFIKIAKDYQQSATDIRDKLNTANCDDDFLLFGAEIYEEYQRALHYRGAIDFDDLIRLALRALESDPEFLQRLQYRWQYILEDEAQDSSRLQEQILQVLTGNDGNWVRVGDPNQAIFETFTTAHPKFLINFLNRPDVSEKQLPNSGRSTHTIMNLANHLIKWSRSEENPNPFLQDTLIYPLIEPTPPNDPQPNPPDKPNGVILYEEKLTPDDELTKVAMSLSKWLPMNQDRTVAVLVPRNERGAKMVEVLASYNIQAIELLQTSKSTRQTARIIADILHHLIDPSSSQRLARLYSAVNNINPSNEKDNRVISQTHNLLRKCRRVEEFLCPSPQQDWLKQLFKEKTSEELISELENFRTLINRWHKAALLPIDQLVLTVSQDLFLSPVDLALAHKLALSLETAARNHTDWRLPEFNDELNAIANNQRKFYGFSNDETAFNPDEHKGKVVVTTIHKAKGLEWDRVYLLSVSNYDFPFGMSGDKYIGEKWFIEDQINIQEEMLARLKALLDEDIIAMNLENGEATRNARIEYARERLRLFYVGITRAKSELTITWNSGKKGNNTPSEPLLAAMRYMRGKSHAHSK